MMTVIVTSYRIHEKMMLLQSIPPGDSMNMGKGYEDNDRLRRSNLS